MVDAGQIERQYEATCGVPMCAVTDHLDAARTKKHARGILWEEGWTKNQTLGWCCPHHDAWQIQKHAETAQEATQDTAAAT